MDYKGKILWYNKKGFGVIKGDNDKEYFLHYSNIIFSNKNNIRLYENEEVTFNVTNMYNKLCATNIKSLSGKFNFEMGVILPTKKKKKKKKNTESFKPSFKPSDMRIRTCNGYELKNIHIIYSNEIILINNLFCGVEDLTIYNNLLVEIEKANVDELLKMWHGNSHYIVDDKKKWKNECPTFNMIIDKIKIFFNMDIKATRFNYYKDSSHWKPYHHDAAAIKPDKSKTQNITVGVSFGVERDASFEHAKTRTVISTPLSNGSIYIFNKDVNIEWRHGIPKIHDDFKHNKGRISIIAWGKVNMQGKK